MKSTIIACLMFTVAPPIHSKTTILVGKVGPSASQLYLANADGSAERRLLAADGFDYDASFSADGIWIVFTSQRERAPGIYRVRLDGSGLQRLTRDTFFDDQGTLSPNGRDLAFVSTRGSGYANVWVMDISSRGLRNLTTDPALQATGRMHASFRPAWSPDGKWIAFSSDRGTDFQTRPGGFEHLQQTGIYIVQSNGTGLRRLSADTESAGSPNWSADGTRVVFYALPVSESYAARFGGHEGPADSQIVAVDVATGARVELTSGEGLKVSPQIVNDNRLAYLFKGDTHHGEIRYGDGAAFLTGEKFPAGAARGAPRNPSWSADGTKVVYHRFEYDSR